MTRFVNHPIFGTADIFATASERIRHSLNSGLPDEEITAPISAWNHTAIAEFGGPLAAELVALEAGK